MLIGPGATSMLLMCAFLLANLLILIVAVLFFDETFLWLQKGRNTKALYMASGIILAILNCVTFICEIMLLNQSTEPMISLYYVAVKLPLMVLTFTMEVITVCYSTYKHQPMKCLHWIAHSLASCHILWFAHRLVTDAIISITSFILAPAQTLGVLTLISSTVACVIIFVAYMIHKGFNGCNKRTCLPMLSAIIIGVTTCGLVFIFTLLFIALVDHGLKSAGIGGFILSLIPPSLIFMVGLLVEWKLSMGYVPHLRNKLSDSVDPQDRPHVHLSAVSVQVGNSENIKESVMSKSPTAIDENTPLLH